MSRVETEDSVLRCIFDLVTAAQVPTDCVPADPGKATLRAAIANLTLFNVPIKAIEATTQSEPLHVFIEPFDDAIPPPGRLGKIRSPFVLDPVAFLNRIRSGGQNQRSFEVHRKDDRQPREAIRARVTYSTGPGERTLTAPAMTVRLTDA